MDGSPLSTPALGPGLSTGPRCPTAGLLLQAAALYRLVLRLPGRRGLPCRTGPEFGDELIGQLLERLADLSFNLLGGTGVPGQLLGPGGVSVRELRTEGLQRGGRGRGGAGVPG